MSEPETCALPLGFTDRMRRLLGAEYPAFLASYDKPRRPALRVNPLRLDGIPDGVRALLPFLAERVPFTADGWYYPDDPALRPGRHPYHEAGLYYIQEASAMIPAALCPPRPGERVLDLCAAPGGKATQLAGALRGQGLLVANEIHPGRAAVLSGNIERMGIPNALVLNMEPQALAERFPGFFDRIVVDAPCSGEGMFRKDEGAIAEWSRQNVDNCWRLQREIVSDIWSCLRPGGLLIYSTCTFNAHEDEENVEWIASELGADILSLPVEAEWGITPAVVGDIPAYRFLPGVSRSEGLFLAVLRKHGDADEAPVKEDNRKAPRRGRGEKAAVVKTPDVQLVSPSDYAVRQGVSDTLLAVPTRWADVYDKAAASLKVMHAGVQLGTVKGKDVVPSQSLALSRQLDRSAFPTVDLAYADAVAYLRKEAVALPEGTPRGYVLLTYDGMPIGFEKNIGNRANNLYPQEWRIKSSHVPDEAPAVLTQSV